MNVTTIGIDLAKNTFSLHGVDRRGKMVFRKTLSRGKLLPFLAQQPPCLIGMEACSGAHYWGREWMKLGHRIGIMAPRFVAPYRKGGKNDGNDAEGPFVKPSGDPVCALCRSRVMNNRRSSVCTVSVRD